MYTLFGMKWAKIFSGPLWSYQPIAQLEHDVEDELDDTVGPRNPVKVSKINKHTLISTLIITYMYLGFIMFAYPNLHNNHPLEILIFGTLIGNG